MNVESFWGLMETCRRQAEGRDARLAWMRNELSRRSQMEIVEFQLRLDQVTRQTFHWDLVAAAERIFGGRCSDDDFDYFGLWMVGLGGEIFGRAVLDPDALADAPEVLALAGRSWRDWGEDWPGWELLDYVASEAYELVTGDPDPCSEEFYAAVRAQRGEHVVSRGLAGERWNARAGAEATRRLPRLSTMFPFRAGS
ncbi:DUF4240 domain-containing protein [Streptomyces flaveolus]|uniref:DUF4240 domain-containing protein n=1 Tax=Streptomyces flaveolus TaxID=67297 RepID=UPI0036F59217